MTFTGVDEYTDIDRLVKIQGRHPYAEFGVLFSRKHMENGNRYPDPSIIGKLSNRGLNLSAHICGGLVRDCYRGDWFGLSALLSDNGASKNMFGRCQLNVSAYDYDESVVLDGNPFGWSTQFIIQQKSASDCTAYAVSSGRHSNVYLLCDPSGGRGVDSGLVLYRPDEKTKMVGYAGGINENNVLGKLDEIAENTLADFWIDMESGVRASDRFDLDAVERVLEKVDKWIAGRNAESERLDADFRSIELKFTVKCSSPVSMMQGGSIKERVRHYIKQCADAMDDSMRHWGDHSHSMEIEAASVAGDDEERSGFNVEEL